LIVALPSASSADTHLVKPDGTGDYLTIQDAIYLAAPEDTVTLANGVFIGEGNRDIVVPSWTTLVVRSDDGNPESCIIDCEGSEADWHRGFVFEAPSASVPGDAFPLMAPSPTGAPWLRNDDESVPLLDGITIRNGYADSGGAILVRHGVPTIRNCILEENTATTGGAIHVEFANPIVRDNTIRSNLAEDGGGISIINASPLIENNNIGYNFAVVRGGGLYREQGVRGEIPSVIRYNVLHHNVAMAESSKGGGIYITRANPVIYANSVDSCQAASGGGIYVIKANPDIINNELTGNVALDKGGGLYLHTCHPFVLNNLIASNEADSGGRGIHNWKSTPYLVKNTITANPPFGLYVSRCDQDSCVTPSHPTLDSCILWNNGTDIQTMFGSGVTVLYSDVEDGVLEGIENISADPNLTGDFCLDSASVCVDAGNPGFPPDPDDSATDMGWLCRADGFDWTWDEIQSLRNDPRDRLMHLMREIQFNMPGAGSQGYVPPDAEALEAWRQAIADLVIGDTLSCSTLVDQYGYDLVNDTYYGIDYYILKERYPIERGWGTYIYNASSASRNVQCHVNHPVYDYDSYKIGLGAFGEYEARWYLIGGSHRYANCEFEPEGDDCESDMARAANSVFQTVYEATADTSTLSFSFHTFSAVEHDVGFWVALSHGSRIFGNIGAMVCTDDTSLPCWRLRSSCERIEHALGDTDRCCVATQAGDQCDTLGATRNQQGVFTNASLIEGNWISVEAATNVAAMDSLYSLVIEAMTPGDSEDQNEASVAPAVVLQCSPNPFSHMTSIYLAAEHAEQMALNIYDISGRLIRGLTPAVVSQGDRQVARWDGRDSEGRQVPSGVYFCRGKAGRHTHTRLMTVIR